ncbi:MAG: SdpI family protein [Ginsengibacter sp.]
MKKKSSVIHWFIILLTLTPLLYLSVIWPSIPDIVPVHYDIHLQPDKMDSKNSLWAVSGLLCGVSLLVYLLLLNVRKFDPKLRSMPPSDTFRRLAIGIAFFTTAMNFLLLTSANHHTRLMDRVMWPLMGLLFAFIGNYLNTIKPNYFAGLRLPWTLSSDSNWRKTHQLAGKLWFWGGLSVAILSLIIPSPWSVIIFFFIMAVMVIIPIVYSYLIFKKEMHESENLQ